MSEETCYHYENKGHYVKTCSEIESKKGQVHTQVTENEFKKCDVFLLIVKVALIFSTMLNF